MKFGKSLSNQIKETLPEWRDKFLSYKDLKKRLKLIGPASFRGHHINDTTDIASAITIGGDNPHASSSVTAGIKRVEKDILKLLEAELEKFNVFFVEKEEEYIIRQKELQDRVERARVEESNEEMRKVRKEIVDFHGEMVLLENYSALNYTGLVKILKKYEKRTGALIRLPFIEKVLQQPFFTTELVYKLVKKCEVMLDHFFPKKKKQPDPNISGAGAGADVHFIDQEEEYINMDQLESLCIMKSSISALRMLNQIRSASSTPGPNDGKPHQVLPDRLGPFLRSRGRWHSREEIRTKPLMKTMASASALFVWLVAISLVADAANPRPYQHPHPEELEKQHQLLLLQEVLDSGRARGCSYRVRIKTSCRSPRLTRDVVALSFGDAYNNQVYAPGLDDPRSKTFERCSTDTFDLAGPCGYGICYLYLWRDGPDGWIPDWVQVYDPYFARYLTFYYGSPIPTRVWYGFNTCTPYFTNNATTTGPATVAVALDE